MKISTKTRRLRMTNKKIKNMYEIKMLPKFRSSIFAYCLLLIAYCLLLLASAFAINWHCGYASVRFCDG